MSVVIVGKNNGIRVVRWPQYFCLSFTLSMIMGLGTGCVFYLLAGRWDHPAVFWGIATGLGIIGLGLYSGLRSPLEKLESLD